MNVVKLADTKAGMVVAIGIVGGLALYFVGKKANETIGDVGNAINPVSSENIFSTGVDSAGAILTDNENFSLGVWIYDLIHDE